MLRSCQLLRLHSVCGNALNWELSYGGTYWQARNEVPVEKHDTDVRRWVWNRAFEVRGARNNFRTYVVCQNMNPDRPSVAPVLLQTAWAKGRIISHLLRQPASHSVSRSTHNRTKRAVYSSGASDFCVITSASTDILTLFRGFPKSLQTNARMVLKWALNAFFHVICSSIFCAIQQELLTVPGDSSLNFGFLTPVTIRSVSSGMWLLTHWLKFNGVSRNLLPPFSWQIS